MTDEQLDRCAQRAVESIAGMQPKGAAETMRELLEQRDLLAQEIIALRRDLEHESDSREKWRKRCMVADDEVQSLGFQLANANVEILNLRRHLLALQTELLGFEEAV